MCKSPKSKQILVVQALHTFWYPSISMVWENNARRCKNFTLCISRAARKVVTCWKLLGSIYCIQRQYFACRCQIEKTRQKTSLLFCTKVLGHYKKSLKYFIHFTHGIEVEVFLNQLLHLTSCVIWLFRHIGIWKHQSNFRKDYTPMSIVRNCLSTIC